MEPSKKTIDRACQWYKANLSTIRALLPLELPRQPYGITLYPANWDITYWINRWESDQLSLADAETYICAQLRPLFDVVRDRLIHG